MLSKKILLPLFAFIYTNCLAENQLQTLYDNNIRAIKSRDSVQMIDSYLELGDYYSESGNYAKGEEIMMQGLKIAIASRNNYKTGVSYNFLAANASYSGDRPKAFIYYHKALKLFTDLRNFDKVASVLMNIGSEYEFGGDIEKGIAYKLLALKNKEASGVKQNLDYYYQSIGQLFKESDHKKWEYYVLKAYHTARTLPDSRIQTKAAIFNDLGGISEARKDYKTALAWYDSMIVVSQKAEYINGLSTAYSNRSLLYKSMAEYDLALKDIMLAMDYDKILKRNYSTLSNKIHAAQILIQLKKTTDAKKYATDALKSADKLKYYPEEEAIAHNVLSKIGEKEHNWKAAYEHYVSYKNGIDSIRGTEARESMHKLELKYQTAEKEKKIAHLNNENKLKSLTITRNRILIYALLTSLLLFAALVFILFTRNKLKQEKHQVELKQQLFRSQMNPHFIFNTLNTINQYVRNNQAEAASDYLARYAKLMRQILENSTVEFIPLDEEIDFLKNYIGLQQLRFSNSFGYEINVSEDIDTENTEILPMVAQPFVENAIEHGLRNMKGNGAIKIGFEKDNSELLMTIQDNGAGLSPQKNNDHKSLAINITRERLRIHKHKDALLIESPDPETNTGVKITIKVPSKFH